MLTKMLYSMGKTMVKPFLLLSFCGLIIPINSKGNTVCEPCKHVETINLSVRDLFCDQPIFTNFLPRDETLELIDNICFTSYPLPDDPDTLHLYEADVYCDGSSAVDSSIVTQFSIGTIRRASPFFTVTDKAIGYVGCDTYLFYRCFNFGECLEPFVFGLSSNPRPLGLSCLRKIEEVIRDQGLEFDDYYVLPQKLPNRCVTQQLCLQPPNPFYNKLPGVALV